MTWSICIGFIKLIYQSKNLIETKMKSLKKTFKIFWSDRPLTKVNITGHCSVLSSVRILLSSPVSLRLNLSTETHTSPDVNKIWKMKQNKAGQKVSTIQIIQDPGPSYRWPAAGMEKTRWLQQIVYINRWSRSKKKDKKIFEIRMLHALKTCEQSINTHIFG